MATVRKLPSGLWNVQIRRKGHMPVSKTFIYQKDANAWIRETESNMDKGIHIDRNTSGVLTLRDALLKYRNEVTPGKKGHIRELQRIAAFLEHPLADRLLFQLKSVDFVRYRDKRLPYVASNTVRLELALLSHVFTVARKEWNIPVGNPIADIRKPKGSNCRTRRLEDGEEDRLLAACKESKNPLLYPLVVMAIGTAMRLSELLNLQWKDINLTKCTVFLQDTKNGTSRTIPLTGSMLEILSSIPFSNERVFYTWQPRSDAMNGSWKLAVKKAGLEDFHFHDLRHEATSRLFEMGLNVLEVSSITGHKSLSMLKRYTHIRPETLLLKMSR